MIFFKSSNRKIIRVYLEVTNLCNKHRESQNDLGISQWAEAGGMSQRMTGKVWIVLNFLLLGVSESANEDSEGCEEPIVENM